MFSSRREGVLCKEKKRSRVCLLEGSKVASNNIEGSQTTGCCYFIEFPRMYMTALFFQLFWLNSRRNKLKVFAKLKDFSLNSRIYC